MRISPRGLGSGDKTKAKGQTSDSKAGSDFLTHLGWLLLRAASLLCLPEEDCSQGFALSSTAGRVKESQYLPSGRGQQDSGGGREGSVGDPVLLPMGSPY